MNTNEKLIFCLNLFILGIILLNMTITIDILRYINNLKPNRPLPMESVNSYFNQNATGLYIPNCGYFVDTRGRSNISIEITKVHEQIHESIFQNQKCGNVSCKKHFCG